MILLAEKSIATNFINSIVKHFYEKKVESFRAPYYAWSQVNLNIDMLAFLLTSKKLWLLTVDLAIISCITFWSLQSLIRHRTCTQYWVAWKCYYLELRR